MRSLDLGIRTAVTEIFNGPVQRIRAEDLDGWFGIHAGRRDLAAVLPPGLLLFEDELGEGFVAIAGGMLDLHRDRCRVTARDAVFARELDDIEEHVASYLERRRENPELQRDVFDDLAKEAIRRLSREERRG